MDKFAALHKLLVELFHDILNIEQKSIAAGEFRDITSNEIHVIEAIEPKRKRRMSDLAKSLKVTVGTLTTAVDALVKKGYVLRKRSETDRRVVQVSLTEKGERLFRRHTEFHDNMITAVLTETGEEESRILVQALNRLTEFFRSRTF